MSAEKCGTGAQFVIYSDLQSVKDKWEELQGIEYHGRAGIILQKIRNRFPNFTPVCEEEIFHRARGLGLTDEE